MKQNIGRYIIYCPIGVTTGGPEALHQLCDYINKLGRSAYLLPIDSSMKPSAQYSHYQTPLIRESELSSLDILIVPETQLKIPTSILIAVNWRVVLWWLSVDNCKNSSSWNFEQKNFPIKSRVWKVQRKKKSLLLALRSIVQKRLAEINNIKFSELNLEKCLHITQSEYARLFLKSYFSISSLMVSDYIKIQSPKSLGREPKHKPVISYNGVKGNLFVEKLSELLPAYEFSAIRNLSHHAAISILEQSALYIDLGHFPGKDRLPREAILQETPVLLANRGATRNQIDFRIPGKYKIDLNATSPEHLANIIKEMLSNRHETLREQQHFYQDCLQSEAHFENEVRKFIELELTSKPMHSMGELNEK
jgi:hypothetical protein